MLGEVECMNERRTLTEKRDFCSIVSMIFVSDDRGLHEANDRTVSPISDCRRNNSHEYSLKRHPMLAMSSASILRKEKDSENLTHESSEQTLTRVLYFCFLCGRRAKWTTTCAGEDEEEEVDEVVVVDRLLLLFKQISLTWTTLMTNL